MKPTFCDNCSGFVSSHTHTHARAHPALACGQSCHITKSGTLWLDHSSRLLHLQPPCCFRSDRPPPFPTLTVCTLFHRSCGASSSKATDAKVITALLRQAQSSHLTFVQTAVRREEAGGRCRSWSLTKVVVRFLSHARVCVCVRPCACAAHCELCFEAHKTKKKRKKESERENQSAASAPASTFPAPLKRRVISACGVKLRNRLTGGGSG